MGLNICLGYKSRKNWPNLTKYGFVLAVRNLSLCTKNCDHMVYTLYRDILKSCTFVFIYVPLSINFLTILISWKKGFHYRFLTMTYIFENWYRDTSRNFWGVLEAIISRTDLDYFKDFSKDFFFSDFCDNNSFITWYFLKECLNLLYIYIYICIYLLKRSLFHLGIIFNFVAMR